MMLVLHTGFGSLGTWPLKGSSWQPCVPGLKGPEGPPFLSLVCHCLSLSPGLSRGLVAAPWTLTQVCTPPLGAHIALQASHETIPGKDYYHFTLQEMEAQRG